MKYVNCPICGHKLLEGDDYSRVRVKCNKCKTIAEVFIGEKGVEVLPVKPIAPVESK